MTSLTPSLSQLISLTRPVHVVDAAVLSAIAWALVQLIKTTRRRLSTTQLKGPQNPSFALGVGKLLNDSPDAGAVYEQWAEEYGLVFKVASALGKTRIVLCDPKAIAHFYARETYGYVLTPLSKMAIENLAGRGLLWSQGDSHKRQRKTLTPAFSNAAIRKLTSVFYDSAYKAKSAWDSIIESKGDSDGLIIEVQNWMNHISLDTIGIAGFSHDFGSLDGKVTSVTEVFDSFGTAKPSPLNSLFFLLAPVFPWLIKLPTSRAKLVKKLNTTMGEISEELLSRTRKEKEADASDAKAENSIIGLLIKAEAETAELHLSPEEVMAQMKVLLIAGYETTSVSLTWALLELAQNTEVQDKLREEILSQFPGADPTYDQLTSGLPYLDAVVHEILRIHPPVPEFTRVAAEDDVLPLSEPVRTASGELVDNISVAKGTLLSINIASLNRSTYFWGPDAKVFNPARWLGEDGVTGKAKEIQGHRHLLTFVDGPRTCLGKSFAITEFKAILVRNFSFEMVDPNAKVEMARGLLPRPRLVGEEGCSVSLRVRRVE
ncbi:cytochrome P450 [Hygrophoropsis aurantiaca]|uniref:Cytochrome P450 n=1 Tax=Hygrophoropsis aurantiaca TaxID=72124 RepID=A0ACB8AKR6_9AGAM|nr:cytochrome P450 [Hygrophoropsis aurantiaca]